MTYKSEYYCECGTHEKVKHYPQYPTAVDKEVAETEFNNNTTQTICIECKGKATAGKVWKGGKFWGSWAVLADGWETP